MNKNGGIPKVEGNVLIENMFVDTSVFFKHKKIIAAAHHKDPPYPVLHKEIKGCVRKIIRIDIPYINLPGHRLIKFYTGKQLFWSYDIRFTLHKYSEKLQAKVIPAWTEKLPEQGRQLPVILKSAYLQLLSCRTKERDNAIRNRALHSPLLFGFNDLSGKHGILVLQPQEITSGGQPFQIEGDGIATGNIEGSRIHNLPGLA